MSNLFLVGAVVVNTACKRACVACYPKSKTKMIIFIFAFTYIKISHIEKFSCYSYDIILLAYFAFISV